MRLDYDVAVVGAGAAGLMAGIFAAREGARVVVLEGAKRVGAKILISGGGRCNVTHDVVRADDFNGNRNAIAKVLRTFSVEATVDFFARLGVPLKREETGKLFPVSDRARTVLDALLDAAAQAGAEVRSDHRVLEVNTLSSGPGGPSGPFSIATLNGSCRVLRVILATGGRSVPKTGSDGFGYELARRLGHTVTPTFPGLVPLVLPKQHWSTALSGTSVEAEFYVRSGSGRIVHRERGSTLFTHFGLSGPAVLDVSRHWIAAQPAGLTINLLPGATFDTFDSACIREASRNPNSTVASFLRARLPDRVIEAFAWEAARVEASTALRSLTRDERRRLAHAFTAFPLLIERDRGFDYAEVTAGGVPLMEIELRAMHSRVCRGLYLCGEILDVDGRIGGYNFQWAWTTGRLAGINAAQSG